MSQRFQSISNYEFYEMSDFSSIDGKTSLARVRHFHWYHFRFDILFEILLSAIAIIFLGVGINKGIYSFFFVYSQFLFIMIFSGLTNIIIVYLLFNKVKFIPGSGSIRRSVSAVKTFLSQIICSQIITYNDQHLLMSDIASSAVASFEVHQAIDSYVDSKSFDQILTNIFDEYMETLNGYNLKILYKNSAEDFKFSIKLRIKTEIEKIIPKIVGITTTEPFYSSNKFHSDIIAFIQENLNSIDEDKIVEMLKYSTKDSFQLAVLWGIFNGGITGIIIFLLLIPNLIKQFKDH